MSPYYFINPLFFAVASFLPFIPAVLLKKINTVTKEIFACCEMYSKLLLFLERQVYMCIQVQIAINHYGAQKLAYLPRFR